MSAELARLQAAYFALLRHVRDDHGLHPWDTASQIQAQHQTAHAAEQTPYHDPWRDAYRQALRHAREDAR